MASACSIGQMSVSCNLAYADSKAKSLILARLRMSSKGVRSAALGLQGSLQALSGSRTCQYLGSLCKAYTAQPTHWSFLMWYPPIS